MMRMDELTLIINCSIAEDNGHSWDGVNVSREWTECSMGTPDNQEIKYNT